MPPNLDPAKNPWLHSDGIRRIFAALQKGGGTVRFVGGCVRDALLGRPVGDIDLATDLTPHKVSEHLQAAKLKVSPTGIEHGTVTAIAYHKGYEITTLRRDVETFGRKAKVEFTDDWKADAGRRDFTMNALYADADGKIFDYFDGQQDLAQGKVRFIGKAEDRIKEDVLRILRFFRFYAWFGKNGPDEESLQACIRLADLLPRLSAERVWREIAKFLAADNPVPSWQLMIIHKILPHLLPEATNLPRLEQLLATEKKFEATSTPIARLAALLPSDAGIATHIAQKLKLSNREADRLKALATLPERMRGKLDIMPFRRMLYEYGPDLCQQAALIFAATEHKNADLEPALEQAAIWQRPEFPLQGEDILKLGIKPGPQIGKILREMEDWWIQCDFRPTKEECLAEAKRQI